MNDIFTENEVKFIAEDEFIEITPTFHLDDHLYLLSGKVGPFIQHQPVRVPLWLAISLKRQAKCRIHPPAWMEIENLEASLRNEKELELFTEINHHFIEVAALLLKEARDDVPSEHRVRDCIKSLTDIRASKLRKTLDKLGEQTTSIFKMNEISAMELNSVRPLFLGAMNVLQQMVLGSDELARIDAQAAESALPPARHSSSQYSRTARPYAAANASSSSLRPYASYSEPASSADDGHAGYSSGAAAGDADGAHLRHAGDGDGGGDGNSGDGNGEASAAPAPAAAAPRSLRPYHDED